MTARNAALTLSITVAAGCGPISRAQQVELEERCHAQHLSPITMVDSDTGHVYQVRCHGGAAWWDAAELPRAIKTPPSACAGCLPKKELP